MKIWMFNHYGQPPEYYPHLRTYSYGKYLTRQGHNVTIFVASSVHNSPINMIKNKMRFVNENHNGIDYKIIKTRNYKSNGLDRLWNMFQYYFGLMAVYKKNPQPDIIIATSVHPLSCVAGIRIAKKRKIPCIVEIADLWPETLIDFGLINKNGFISKILYFIERWIYMNANKIIFTMEGGSQYIIDKYEKISFALLDKTYHINNGIDLITFYENRDTYNYYDDDLDETECFKVVYTGSIREANEVIQLIKAAEIFHLEKNQKIKFIIFGDGNKKEELMNYLEIRGISNVHFKKSVEKKYIPSILSKSNLNVMTGKKIHLYEYGISLNKLFDYLASGKPILSNIEVRYDLLNRYKCGLTVSGENHSEIYRGIKYFYDMSHENYLIYCDNAKKASLEFDYSKTSLKLENIIKTTVDEYKNNLK